MMDYRNNVRAVLETCFAGFKDELIEAATDRICDIKEKPLFMVKADGSIEPLQLKVKRGRWLKQTINGHDIDLCSCCWHTWHKMPSWHYCPGCGAKMEGENNANCN